MATLITTFFDIVDALTSEGVATTSQEIKDVGSYRLIREAVQAYSADMPDEATTDVTGDAGKYYPIAANLTSWSEGFSAVLRVEYPAATIASDETPLYLDDGDWDADYWYDGTRYLWLPNHAPAATETMRIKYSVPYTWTASSTTTAVAQTGHGFSVDDYIYQENTGDSWTEAADAFLATHQVTVVTDADNFTCATLETAVPREHFFAVCNKAACLICQAIAAKYSRIGDTMVSADSANHTTKAQEFQNRATSFCNTYADMLGLATAGGEGVTTKPAQKFVGIDTSPGWRRGRQYLFHRNR